MSMANAGSSTFIAPGKDWIARPSEVAAVEPDQCGREH